MNTNYNIIIDGPELRGFRSGDADRRRRHQEALRTSASQRRNLEVRVPRRRAAVLMADMVGYSRLMEANEEDLFARQKQLEDAVIRPVIARFGGRIVNFMGDGVLVEFAEGPDAVLCGIAIQQGIAAREASVPEDKRIRFRIGINLAHVIVDGDDIAGTGVNLAIRLEALATPGGLCVSDAVRRSVSDLVGLSFEDMGEQQVKNIKRPVRAFGMQVAEH